ncbi:MAG: NAD(P)/FAD-dependent oxidoreductase [Phycisphaerae bacterium]|nr:NAD(P)/FAD-dependent oxidoreductase [Phycisphaerae bacterium]
MAAKPYDCIIVGGGPAGLNAALVLARCRRRIFVIDAGSPRNAPARSMHNFLTRDGINPSRLLQLARTELARYGVTVRKGLVTSATYKSSGKSSGFRVRVGNSRSFASRTLLLATGVVDELPGIPDFRTFYGAGVHHCPYCDGWQYSDRRIAAFGRGRHGLGLAKSLLTWSKDISIVTHGERPTRALLAEAHRFNIRVCGQPIAALRGNGRRVNRLNRIVFADGDELRVDALFFNTDQRQRSRLPIALGCTMGDDGGVVCDRRQRTGVPGLYLAGDASREVQFVIVAAAEGASAAVAINSELQKRDRGEDV